jgi:uncharacterized Zn finger protein
MRIVLIICRRCRHQEKVEILTEEEKRDPRVPRSPIRCSHCGNFDVEVRS